VAEGFEGSRVQGFEAGGAVLRNYRDLIVWQKAMDLLVEVYAVTRLYPSEERFGLAAHTRRSAVSVPSNIAEGYSRRHRAEYNRHLDIAYASTAEQPCTEKRTHRGSPTWKRVFE
jgi:hypothetical protein